MKWHVLVFWMGLFFIFFTAVIAGARSFPETIVGWAIVIGIALVATFVFRLFIKVVGRR